MKWVGLGWCTTCCGLGWVCTLVGWVSKSWPMSMSEHAAANGSQTHGRPCRHIESALSTGDGLWPLLRHMWWRSREVAEFAALCIRRTLCRHVTICTPMVIFCCLTVFWLFLTIRTLYQSSKTLKTIGVPIVTGLPRLYQQCTNRQKQWKTVKRQSKKQKWRVKVKGLRDLWLRGWG